MCGVVYLICNKANGKKYVGQTVRSLQVRLKEHSKSKQTIGKAIRKYGWGNFRYGVIKTCSSKAELDYWEKFFIATLKSKAPHGYNMTNGGKEGITGYHHSPERLAKISAARKGKRHAPEVCAKISAALKGKAKTPEHRAKISASEKRTKQRQNDG